MRYEYGALQKMVTELGAPDISHSAFETVEHGGTLRGDNWIVDAPDLQSVFMNGRVQFTRGEGWTSKVFTDPTHADVLRSMQDSAKALDDFHHVFYEGTVTLRTVEPETCAHCGREPGAEEGPVSLVEILTGS